MSDDGYAHAEHDGRRVAPCYRDPDTGLWHRYSPLHGTAIRCWMDHPTERTEVAQVDVDWPCDERVAHGPHPVTVHRKIAVNPDGAESWKSGNYDCPGVQAHSATMIGGANRPQDGTQ